MVTPAVLRVENKENILLEAFGLSQPVSVSLSVYDFPVKSKLLWKETITLNSDNNYSVLQTIKVNSVTLVRALLTGICYCLGATWLATPLIWPYNTRQISQCGEILNEFFSYDERPS